MLRFFNNYIVLSKIFGRQWIFFCNIKKNLTNSCKVCKTGTYPVRLVRAAVRVSITSIIFTITTTNTAYLQAFAHTDTHTLTLEHLLYPLPFICQNAVERWKTAEPNTNRRYTIHMHIIYIHTHQYIHANTQIRKCESFHRNVSEDVSRLTVTYRKN